VLSNRTGRARYKKGTNYAQIELVPTVILHRLNLCLQYFVQIESTFVGTVSTVRGFLGH